MFRNLGMKFYAFLTIYSLPIQGKGPFTRDGNGVGAIDCIN